MIDIRQAYARLDHLYRRTIVLDRIYDYLYSRTFSDVGDESFWELLNEETQTVEFKLDEEISAIGNSILAYYDTPKWKMFRKMGGWEPLWSEYWEVIAAWGYVAE